MYKKPMFLVGVVLALTCLYSSTSYAQPPKSMKVDLDQGHFVGIPIHWGNVDGAILERSGRIQVFEQRNVREHQLLEEAFAPTSLIEAKAQLSVEMGPNFETIVTGPYVIATPRGEAGRWEQRFNTLLAGYQRYFATRGGKLRKPDFPLVVIVLPTREAFQQRAANETKAGNLPDNLAGMYVPRSNRCLLYNVNDGNATNWQATEATIVHEGVHQLAYNSGVHERLFEHPLWFVEGLATMFEVPTVYDSNLGRDLLTDRIHHGKARDLVKLVGRDPDSLGTLLDNLVSSDHLFRAQPNEAYALAWAMTFFLAERMPTQYFYYIELQKHRGFRPYPAAERELDFRRAFDTTAGQLAPHIMRIVGQ